jgi:hypothetical protein
MKVRPNPSLILTNLVTIAALSLSACGSNRPTEQAAAPAASSAPAAASPALESAAAPAAPPEAPPAAARHVPKATPKAAPQPAPALAANPTPIPKPEPVLKTIAAGTELEVDLLGAVSSKTSKVGDAVRARVTKAVFVDGLSVIPVGAVINGTITEAVPLNKIGGTASLGLRFDSLELASGAKTGIAAGLSQKGKSENGKDAGTIAGATAGGALLGRLLSKNDKTKGTIIGAVVGAAAGTGIAAATKGQEIELSTGTALALHLEQPLTISVQP